MSQTLEHVYSLDVSAACGAPKESVYDGRYLWVIGTTGLAILEFWGTNSGDEPSFDELDELVYSRYDAGGDFQKLRLVTSCKITSSFITRSSTLVFNDDPAPSIANTFGAMSPSFMCKLENKMYIASGSSFSKIFVFDIAKQRFETVITLPTLEGNSNLIAAGDKLWFTNKYYDDLTPQRLYNYTPGDMTVAYVNIPVAPSASRVYLCDGYNGFVYMANYNNVSVSKFNSDTGAFVSTIRTNALPSRIVSDQNRRIFVNSFAGMLTLIDWDDDHVHHDYSTENPVPSIALDPSNSDFVWFVTGSKMVRYSLSTKQQLETLSTEDWGILGLPANPSGIFVSPEQTYTNLAGSTVTVKPYVITLHDTKVCAFRLDAQFLYRVSFSETNGQGAVSSPLKYFGES